jgi:hypothetical protein
MSRTTYVWRDGRLIEKHLAAPISSGPNIISDTMAPIRSMADGKLYDSKSAYYGSVKAAGCEIVGNDPSSRAPKRDFQPVITGHDVKQAIEQLRSR